MAAESWILNQRAVQHLNTFSEPFMWCNCKWHLKNWQTPGWPDGLHVYPLLQNVLILHTEDVLYYIIMSDLVMRQCIHIHVYFTGCNNNNCCICAVWMVLLQCGTLPDIMNSKSAAVTSYHINSGHSMLLFFSQGHRDLFWLVPNLVTAGIIIYIFHSLFFEL